MPRRPTADYLNADTDLPGGATGPSVPLRDHVLTVLCHPNLSRVGERAVVPPLEPGQWFEVSRLGPQFHARDAEGGEPLVDTAVSRRPLRIGREGSELLLDSSASGSEVSVEDEVLRGTRRLRESELERGVVVMLARRVVLLLHRSVPAPETPEGDLGLVGESDAIRVLRARIPKVADTAVPVLLLGETGTGKELTARAIHACSPRNQGPFIAVNMGALAPSLAASELFGHSKGAFTGAVDEQLGHFRHADGGSLFLDEVGGMADAVQLQLLRVLETSEVQPVGARRLHRVDTRVIAATDADLDAAVEAGGFRSPLLHRLAGYVIKLPPLRERRDDIGRLLVHFLELEMTLLHEEARLETPPAGRSPWLRASLVARLARYDWPGNIRQLRNAARQIAISGRDSDSTEADDTLEQLLSAGATRHKPGTLPPQVESRHQVDIDDDTLIAALRRNAWRREAAARDLGVSRTTIYALIRKCDRIRSAGDLSAEEIAAAREQCGNERAAVAQQLEVSEHALKLRLRELGLD